MQFLSTVLNLVIFITNMPTDWIFGGHGIIKTDSLDFERRDPHQ
jgi:hypothetical protein